MLTAVSGRDAENGVFWLKCGTLTVSMLQKRQPVKKAERPLLHCKNGRFGLPFGPYCSAKRPK